MAKAKVKKPVEPDRPQGIQELIWVDPNTLDDNPLNWKKHPESQRAGIRASIQTNGWAGALLYNRRTERLLDGHGRKSEAIRQGWDRVPVLVGEWDELTEQRILQTLDPLGSMFTTDPDKLSSLNALVAQSSDYLRKTTADTRKVLEALQGRLQALPEAIEDGRMSASPLPLTMLNPRKAKATGDDSDSDNASTHVDTSQDQSEVADSAIQEVIAEDVLFASTNPWGIPDLDEALLAGPELAPDRTYSRVADSVTSESYYCHSARPFLLREEMGITGGVLGFFCEDWRFEAGYKEASNAYRDWIEGMEWGAVCAPDYSIYATWPFSMNLWQLYRSRWVARFWQSLGVKIIPVLSSVYQPNSETIDHFLSQKKTGVAKPGKVIDISLATLPSKVPVVATQCRTLKHQGGDFRAYARWLSLQVETIKPQVVIIYGGGEHAGKFLGYLPKQGPNLRYVLLNSYMNERRGWIEKQKRERRRAKE